MKAGDAIAQKTEDAIDRIRWSKMEAEEKKVEADHLTKYREERALEAKIAEKARSEKAKAALLAKVKKPTADDEEESEEEEEEESSSDSDSEEGEDDDPDKRSPAEKILDGMSRPDLDKPK